MKVSEIIQEIMAVNELSQDNLADILCVSQRAVSNWVNEKALPNASSILCIYDKFGITPNELLGLEEPHGFCLKKKQ